MICAKPQNRKILNVISQPFNLSKTVTIKKKYMYTYSGSCDCIVKKEKMKPRWCPRSAVLFLMYYHYPIADEVAI